MTPFMYPYHADPFDYFRPTFDYLRHLSLNNSLYVSEETPIGVGPFHVFFNYISLVFNITLLSRFLLILAIIFDGFLKKIGLKSNNFFIYTLVKLTKIK
jgi:hypothetical protein